MPSEAKHGINRILKKSALFLHITTIASGLFMIGFLTVGFLLVNLNSQLPDAENIRGVELKVPLRIYSADQQLISEFGNERRKPIDISDMPRMLINAVLASEDDGFYNHHGIDISGLFRAALSNFRSGETRQGASTITMQVARNFFLSREKTYMRKLKEVMLAIKIEQILTKDEILSLYLNKIFLGHRSYGFGAAADVYYDKPLEELNIAQIAMLAGLPKAPSAYNPLRNPERATKRRNYVLSRLESLEYISEAEFETAKAEQISAKKHARQPDLAAPHIAEMARSQLTEQFGEQAYWQGLNVYTTILSKQQNAAMAALRKGLQAYDRRHGFRGPIAKLDLDGFNYQRNILNQHDNDDELWQDNLDNLMSIYPSSQEQLPAVIINSDESQATAYTSEHGAVTLTLESVHWAKRHLTANQVGDRPTNVSDVLQVGDVVYITENEERSDETDTTKDKPQTADNETQEIIQQSKKWQLSQIPNIGGSIISIEPNTGRILSLVGGYDFFINKYNRAIQSIRQPGSNIKPFIYSASLDQGFTPATLISGAPIVMTDRTHGTVWRPENYSGKFYGPTRMREALGKSMNLVSIRLLRSIGVPVAREYTSRFGIDMSRFAPTLTMALGSGGVTPLEMVSAYGVLANGGYKVEPYFIEKITDREGNIVYLADQVEYCDECYMKYIIDETDVDSEQNSAQSLTENAEATPNEELQNTEDSLDLAGEEGSLEIDDSEKPEPTEPVVKYYQAPRVMNRANNFLTVSMLKDVVRRGTARRALALNRRDLAGKTGTTNDYVDAWFTGFNSQVATTVWVGFDDPATMGRGEAGSLTALPIWVDYMRTGLEGVPEDTEEVPDYIEAGLVNRTTGKRTDETDPAAITEYFPIKELLPELNYISADSDTLIPDELVNGETEDGNPLNTNDSDLEGEDTDSPFSSSPQDDANSIQQQERIIEQNNEATEELF